MDPILQTNELSKIYKKKNVLNNVTITIDKGEIVGFVGENGAGKTTLIRLITGVAFPSKGKIDITFSNKKNGSISAIVETPSLYLNSNATSNLYNQFLLLGHNDVKKEDVEELLRFVGLGEVVNNNKLVKNFSLGMKQRLSIAFALASNPEFVLLDEPMNGLDPEGIVEIRDLIKSLNKDKNITFLISSHLLNELSKVATKYCFIHKGEIIKVISAHDLENPILDGLEVSVDNLDLALELLSLKYEGTFVRDNKIVIKENAKYSEVSKILESHGVNILSINKVTDDIEKYYLNLIGGLK